VVERDLKASCCLDSYNCPDDLRLDRKRWEGECDEYRNHPGYLAENLKGRELVVVLAFLLWSCRWLTQVIISTIALRGKMPILRRIFAYVRWFYGIHEWMIKKLFGYLKLLICFWNPMFWEGGLEGEAKGILLLCVFEVNPK
jgi:hypothetical protein